MRFYEPEKWLKVYYLYRSVYSSNCLGRTKVVAPACHEVLLQRPAGRWERSRVRLFCSSFLRIPISFPRCSPDAACTAGRLYEARGDKGSVRDVYATYTSPPSRSIHACVHPFMRERSRTDGRIYIAAAATRS